MLDQDKEKEDEIYEAIKNDPLLTDSFGYMGWILGIDEAYKEIIYDKARTTDGSLDFIGWMTENFEIKRKR